MAILPRAKTQPGARVKLRVEFGAPPPVPCVLVTESGRRYDVVAARGKTLHCIVMRADAPITAEDGPVMSWRWTARNKRVEP